MEEPRYATYWIDGKTRICWLLNSVPTFDHKVSEKEGRWSWRVGRVDLQLFGFATVFLQAFWGRWLQKSRKSCGKRWEYLKFDLEQKHFTFKALKKEKSATFIYVIYIRTNVIFLLLLLHVSAVVHSGLPRVSVDQENLQWISYRCLYLIDGSKFFWFCCISRNLLER